MPNVLYIYNILYNYNYVIICIMYHVGPACPAC